MITGLAEYVKLQQQLIADKILNGARLTLGEKKIVYRLLTKEDPPKRRGKGRPSTSERDNLLALHYLLLKPKARRNTKKLKMELATLYGVDSQQIDSVEEAIKRGKKQIGSESKLLSNDYIPIQEMILSMLGALRKLKE